MEIGKTCGDDKSVNTQIKLNSANMLIMGIILYVIAYMGISETMPKLYKVFTLNVSVGVILGKNSYKNEIRHTNYELRRMFKTHTIYRYCAKLQIQTAIS